MVCLYCYQKTRVANSRVAAAGYSIWRRRYCSNCQTAFTTSEQIVLESVIAFKTADGILKALRREDIYISVFNALGGLKSLSEAAEHLTRTCINKLLQQGQSVLDQQQVEKIVFETLNAYQTVAGQRYLLNEIGRTQL